MVWPGSMGPPVRAGPPQCKGWNTGWHTMVHREDMTAHWGQQSTQLPYQRAEDKTCGQVPHPNDDSKYLCEGRPCQPVGIARDSSATGRPEQQRFREIASTWAEPSVHAPHGDPGLISGGRSPSSGTGVVGRLGMASSLICPVPHNMGRTNGKFGNNDHIHSP